jgi:hypothetical protein
VESYKFRPDQQRAYYNLAYINAAYDRQYDKACVLLREALKYKVWQRVTTPAPMLAYVYYNLGCCLARILASERPDGQKIGMEEAKDVRAALRKASETWQIEAEDVHRDFSHRIEGDIYGLCERADPELLGELNRIRQALMAEYAKKPRQRFMDKTIAEVFDPIRNFMKKAGWGSKSPED